MLMPGSLNPKEAIIYAARPGLRLWKASLTGGVEITLIFKDLLTATSADITFIGGVPMIDEPEPASSEVQFGKLFVFTGKYLLTCDGRGLFLIDPQAGRFLCYHCGVSGVIDVAVNDDEVFLLAGRRSRTLIRVAQKPYRCKLPAFLSGKFVTAKLLLRCRYF